MAPYWLLQQRRCVMAANQQKPVVFGEVILDSSGPVFISMVGSNAVIFERCSKMYLAALAENKQRVSKLLHR
jgi:hypothetical protein